MTKTKTRPVSTSTIPENQLEVELADLEAKAASKRDQLRERMTKAVPVADELKTQEKIVARGETAFIDACRALRKIDTLDLWKGRYADCESFSDYCALKWDMNRTQFTRYRNAGKVIENLDQAEPKFERLPKREGQCRMLAKLSADNQCKVWAECQHKKVNAALIEKTALSMGVMTAPKTRTPKTPAVQYFEGVVKKIASYTHTDFTDDKRLLELFSEIKAKLTTWEAALTAK